MAFKTCYDHFKYQIIFFGLTNVLATYQSYINKILVEKLYIFIIVYLDNIFIYIESKKKTHKNYSIDIGSIIKVFVIN